MNACLLVRKTKVRTIALVSLLVVPGWLMAQNPLMSFKVNNNAMQITLARKLSARLVDSFIDRYNLSDIGLRRFVRDGNDDSLIFTGWMVDRDAPNVFVIRKMLPSTDPTSPKTIFSPIPTPENWREIGGNRIVFGVNKFRDGKEFLQENGVVNFHLTGFTNNSKVRLAGNFTNWQQGAFPMTKTGDGWTAQVKLPAGQYYYKFLIGNGAWITDPANELSENDGRGNENSMFYVPNRSFFLKNHHDAQEVFLTGNFINWVPGKLPLHRTSDGWRITMYLQPGTWQYYFLVDGKPVQAGDSLLSSLGEPHLFLLAGYENAKKVMLAGDFNDWKENELPMKRVDRGWQASYVLGPGNYQYKFIVDGQWTTDPQNSSLVDDGRGNTNSFLIVGANYTFRLKAYPTAKNVFLAGDFNNWTRNGIAMRRQGNEWVASVYLAKGKHLYGFLVDGRWVRDPDNRSWEENEFAAEASVLWLEAEVPVTRQPADQRRGTAR